MPKLKLISIFTTVIIFFQSCTVIFPVVKANKDKDKKITHSQVMSRYKTKKDVLRTFGVPSSKEVLEGIEIWYYDKGTSTSTYSYGNAKTNLNSRRYSGINANTNASARSTTSSYTSYVEFQFQNDLVTNWRSKGVNYGSKPTWLGAYFLGLLVDCTIAIVIALGV
tara:strand:- start:364 stop:861 length:498 start_codon:yes stop_codon:yes gene_type:complete